MGVRGGLGNGEELTLDEVVVGREGKGKERKRKRLDEHIGLAADIKISCFLVFSY